MLDIGGVTFHKHYEPPRPVLAPRTYARSLVNQWAGFTTTSEGRDHGRPVTFASDNRHGFVTPEQAQALISLYEAGGSFTVTTDLLHPDGTAPSAYVAIFAPAQAPLFHPVTPDGTLYSFEIALLIAGAL